MFFFLTLADCICLIIAFIVAVLFYYKWAFNYWKNKNVTYLEPKLPFGNVKNPVTPESPIHVYVGKLYDEVKSKEDKHGGFYFFTMPIYVPVDPNLLRNVLASDFNHFTDRGVYINEKVDPLSCSLFTLQGQRWKTLRAKLTPTFTSGKMKNMFFIMLNAANNMIEHINGHILTNDGILNVKDVMGCFTTDVIGSAAFGLECNSFKNPDSAFRYFGKRVFKPTTIDQVRGLIGFVFPNYAKKLGIPLFDKKLSTFFMDLVRKTIDNREANNIIRKDFLQLLIDMKNSQENNLTFNEVAAQSFLFFIAGFETSSTTMSFALYEMALNFTVQAKARNEVLSVLKKYNDELTYDGIMELKYLQQVIDETLRKYPTLPVLNRKVTETYKVPETDVILEKNLMVFVPVYSLHHDPEYYPDPEVFDPERFTEENKQNRKHFTYMPFGDGPRNCIGLRFGLLQAKIGLALLLKNYNISINERTKVPVELDPISFVIATKDDILLNLTKNSQENN